MSRHPPNQDPHSECPGGSGAVSRAENLSARWSNSRHSRPSRKPILQIERLAEEKRKEEEDAAVCHKH